MCGIASVLLHPQHRSDQIWADLRETFTRNLLANEERGQAATGVAVVQRDGRALVFKLACEASAFVETIGYHNLWDVVDERTVMILGHTRLPTRGSPDDPHNNHPIEAGDVLGVHNGHIDNADELFRRWRLLRRAEVDSEVLFRRMAAFSPLSLNGQYLPTLTASLAELEGYFTFLAVDVRQPAHLLAYKHYNPLSMHYHAAWQALFFSSEYLFLRLAFGHIVSAEMLPRDRLLCFDALRLPELGAQPSNLPRASTQISLLPEVMR